MMGDVMVHTVIIFSLNSYVHADSSIVGLRDTTKGC